MERMCHDLCTSVTIDSETFLTQILYFQAGIVLLVVWTKIEEIDMSILETTNDPQKKYKIILADPPWRFGNKKTGGGMKSGAESHYRTMSLENICSMPINDIAEDDCVLFMWWVASMPQFALSVVDAWGFKLKTMTGFCWEKETVHGKPFFGMGFWTRCLNPDAHIFVINSNTGSVEYVELEKLLLFPTIYRTIWTINGWRHVSNVWSSFPDDQMEIHTPQTDFICSNDHRWLTKVPHTPRYDHTEKREHLHKARWLSTEEISKRKQSINTEKTSSTNLLASNIPVEPPNPICSVNGFVLTEDLMWLLGLYVAEGNGSLKFPYRIRYSLGSHEEKYYERIAEIVKSLNLFSMRYKNKKVMARIFRSKKTKSIVVSISCLALKKLINSFCFGNRAYNKRLNMCLLLNISAHLRKFFLRGILDGDGTHSEDGGYEGFRKISLASEGLVDDLRALSQSLGVITSKGGPYTVKSSICRNSIQYTCFFSSHKCTDIEFDGHRIQPITISNIQQMGIIRKLIDIEVDGGHFVVDGIITHNSGTENCLIATKGHPKRMKANVRSVISAPNVRHSKKPPEVRDRIVDLIGDVPRIELFARERVVGWEARGLDLDGIDLSKSLVVGPSQGRLDI
jgi:N6-adenosine-specific RNA methylase IME4